MAGYPGYPAGNFAPYEAETAPQYTEYSGLVEGFGDEEPPENERWKWVAGIAAAVLAIAVIATTVVLNGGGNKPPTKAVTTSAPSLTPISTPSASAPPSPSATTSVKPSVKPPSSTTTPPSTVAETPSTVSPEPAPETPAAPPSNPLLPPDGQTPITPTAFAYYVTGNQTPGDLLTITYTDGNGATRTVLGASLPWSMIVTPSPGIVGGSITATSFASQINCTISNSEHQILAVQSNNSLVARCAK